MPAKPESRLQKKIQDAIEARHNAACFKIHGGIYSSGIPDLLVCYRGYFVALEVKTPDNKAGATKLQQGQLRRIKRAGGYAFVIRSVDDAMRILNHIDRKLDVD